MKKKAILIYTIITLIFFGRLIQLEYATDTYAVFNFNKDEIYMQFATSGRFLTAIIGSILKHLKISEITIYLGSYFVAILGTILSQNKLYKIIKGDIKWKNKIEKKILNIIIPILIIINPFTIELFMFIEKGIMILGVFLCIYALDNTVKYFETKKKRHIIISCIFMFLANCSYQGIIGIYISISLVYILKYSKNIKEFLINNILVGVIYGLPALLNIIIVNICFKSNRLSGNIEIFESLKIIMKKMYEMCFETYNLMPKYVLICIILFTFMCICSKIMEERNKIKHIFSFLYIVFGIILFACLPQIVQPTKSIWFVPRATYCFGAIYGILVLYLAINYEIHIVLKYVAICVSVLVLLLQLQSFIKLEKDRYILNKKDFEITSEIIKKIKEYETSTDYRINAIKIYQDKEPQYTYRGIFSVGDINVKCYLADWSIKAILQYYLKRDIELVNVDKKELNQNWDEFKIDEQIFFENEILILYKF